METDDNKVNFDLVVANETLLKLGVTQLKKKIELDPKNTNLVWQLAETYRKLGELSEAATLYGQLSHQHGDQFNSHAKDLYAILMGNVSEVTGKQDCSYPVSFVSQRDYLSKEDLQKLMDHIKYAAWDACTPSVVGAGDYDDSLRKSFDLPMPKWLGQKIRQDILSRASTLSSQLKLGDFSADRLDLSLRAYADGHFFGLHTDRNPNISRCISATYFFYFEPKSFEGGDLLIFDTHLSQEKNRVFTESFTRIKPIQNTLVFFPSASYHAVSKVNTCKSVTGYRYAINAHIWEKNNNVE